MTDLRREEEKKTSKTREISERNDPMDSGTGDPGFTGLFIQQFFFFILPLG